jgi:hypothetical protein
MLPKQQGATKAAATAAPARSGHPPVTQKGGSLTGMPASIVAKQTNVSTTAPTPSTGTDLASVDPSEQHSKIPKPSATEVANKLLKVLLVSEPMQVADICKQMPDVPKDSVQSVLEVLQVLGLVTQSSIVKESGSSRSSSAANFISMFSLTEFVKFSTAFPITNIEADLSEKQQITKMVTVRNEQLQVDIIVRFECIWSLFHMAFRAAGTFCRAGE